MAPIIKDFLTTNSMSRSWLTALEDLISDWIKVPLNQVIQSTVTVWPWSDWFSTCVAFYDEHFLTITGTFLLINIPYIWYLYSSECEKVRQCYMIQRIMDKPSGPERDSVILDICLELNSWYAEGSGLGQWRGEMLMDVPGAEKHWEEKHPGRKRRKYRWWPGERCDKFDLSIFHWDSEEWGHVRNNPTDEVEDDGFLLRWYGHRESASRPKIEDGESEGKESIPSDLV